MNYNVSSIPLFDKQAKRLAKKYPSLKCELTELFETLASEPQQGEALGNNFFKIRLAIASKGKGKSGGARIITFIKVVQNNCLSCFHLRQIWKIEYYRQRTWTNFQDYSLTKNPPLARDCIAWNCLTTITFSRIPCSPA